MFSSQAYIASQATARFFCMALIPLLVYTSSFYVHVTLLKKAGPHSRYMTSQFQATLEVGIAFAQNKTAS